MDTQELTQILAALYREVRHTICSRQHPITGLLPASTAVTLHGNYRDAWVRDNVYSILAVWGLGLAYRRIGDPDGVGHELEQRSVMLMRGLLRSMMHQSAKVEAFKHSCDPRDALHAKYDTASGSPVVGDQEWGHLQLDATSLYLLTLAQMITSGLDIIWTNDEVNFVQNLIYYIERAYRTPDYGIWERGAKTNRGSVELNASSVGMAYAALESLAGFNLFGARGGQASVVHVNPDSVAQTGITLSSILPRESNTKETDGALLSSIGFPAYAIKSPEHAKRLREQVSSKLEGNYGLKRFLRDGHQTVLEDPERLHYEEEELRQFENIESEWPLFFAYLYLDAGLRGDTRAVERYRQRIQDTLVERNGMRLLPELYYVPEERIAAERKAPKTQSRVPNGNVPLVWAQSLYLLGRMLDSGVLRPGDIDPLGRRHMQASSGALVQVAILAEDTELQKELASYGILSETLEEIEPVLVRSPEDIARTYAGVGVNHALGLGGRPPRPPKTLCTSRIFRIRGETVVCPTPLLMLKEFYLTHDLQFVVQRLQSELAYLQQHWTLPGRPTVTLLLTRGFLNTDTTPLLQLFQQLNAGNVSGVRVRTGRLAGLSRTACLERIDSPGVDLRDSAVAITADNPVLQLPGHQAPLPWAAEKDLEQAQERLPLLQRLGATDNLYEQVEVLSALARIAASLDDCVEIRGATRPLRALLEEVYEQAGRLRLWAVSRQAAGLLGKVDADLHTAAAALLVRQKAIQVGRSYTEASLITKPIPEKELLAKISTFCRGDVRDEVLTQELVIYLSLLIKARPQLFEDLTTLRVSHLILLLVGQLRSNANISDDEAYERLLASAPSTIQQQLEVALARYEALKTLPQELEQLPAETTLDVQEWKQDLGLENLTTDENWLAWRRYHGVVDRRTQSFYSEVWEVFSHTLGLAIGDKLDRRNRLKSAVVLGDMTAGEKSFALAIDHLLNKLPAPEYRQLNVECLSVLASFFKQNPGLRVQDTISLDATIGHAVRLGYVQRRPERIARYTEYKARAWAEFYATPPQQTAALLVKALRHLLHVRVA